jgi:hypothetical protein
MYTKGLAVIDDVAYFGISPAQPKEGRADTSLDCELVAYDLVEGRLLWRRKVMPPLPVRETCASMPTLLERAPNETKGKIRLNTERVAVLLVGRMPLHCVGG